MVSRKFISGVQCTGKLHIGNIVSVVFPTIEIAKHNDTLVFLADLHTLTTIKDKRQLHDNILHNTAVWLACGMIDIDNIILYRQSRIKGICELMWWLNCLTPYPMLANAHAFKDKSNNLSDVNIGLFDYPILMAADILIMKADYVIVGQDQKQHIEITRDIAKKFNNIYGNILTIPKEYIHKDIGLISGTDGKKMSKSYNNTIDIFDTEEELHNKIFSIKTDSKSPQEQKNPKECNIFKIYSVIADKEDIVSMEGKYINGKIGYREAKEALLDTILTKYKSIREKFQKLIMDKKYLNAILERGEKKAQKITEEVSRFIFLS